MLAVITGASSGIGATFARKLAARGYDLLLVARREDRLRSIAGELRDLHHVRAEYMIADLTEAADRNRVSKNIREAKDLALLVNNAGFGTMGYFWEADVDAQERMHQLHVVATMVLTHAAVANLFPRGEANTGVINVSSVAAFGSSPQSVGYGSTKAWINAFTAALATELAGRGSRITVQALCPGFTLSEFHDVVKMDRSAIPKSLWMTSDFVVEESLKAFDRGALIVVPGWRYKLLVAAIKLIPAGLLRKVSIAAVRRYRKQKQA